MSWTKQDENFLIHLQEEINDLTDLYKQQYISNKNMLCKIYKIPTITMSSICSFLSVANYGYIEKDAKWVSLIVGLLNLLVSTLTIIENYKGIERITTLSEQTYKELTLLSNDISLCLSIEIEERFYKSGIEAINAFYNRFTNITKNSNILNENTHHHLYLSLEQKNIELKRIISKNDLGEIKI